MGEKASSLRDLGRIASSVGRSLLCYVIGFVLVVDGVLANCFDRYSLVATSLFTLGIAVGAAGFLTATAPALVVITGK